MRKKITVVGAGFVGATTTQRLAERKYADLVMVDIVEGLPQGKALDMQEAGPVVGYDCKITGTNNYEDTAKSDIVVITSGVARKPGMSRDDLVLTNMNIVKGVTEQIVRHSPNCILIVVTNPLDAMAQLAWKVSGFPRCCVIGQSGVLDSARFRAFIAMELNVSAQNVDTLVLGGHGDSMVPLPRYTTVGGVPLTDLLPPDRVAALVQRTRDGGAEIVSLLKTGSAFYAPAAAVVEMVDAIMYGKNKILPCSVYLDGEYGIKGVYSGVPVRLGARGAEGIVEFKLNPEEQAALERSAAAVRELIAIMKL
jgi:malate dehydrogenase